MNENTFVINLTKLANNYKYIQKLTNTEIGCVVKSNAYGFGLLEISKVLYDLGAQYFFVYSFAEALLLSEYLGNSIKILVLDGLIEPDCAKNIYPAVVNIHQFNMYHHRSIWLHFDSGINRSGIHFNEFEINKKILCNAKNIGGVLSHLAYKYADHPYHIEQLQRTQYFFNFFNCTKSLSKSIALELGENFWFDLLRIGHALYFKFGHLPQLENIGNVYSYITSIFEVKKGEKIGYNGTYIATEDSKIALVNIGYADGVLSNYSTVKVHETICPIVGIVSMNCLNIDITNCASVKINDIVNITYDNYENICQKSSLGYITAHIRSSVKRHYIK